MALVLLMLALGVHGAPADAPHITDPLAWPQPTRASRPWTRWWWPGSAVDADNLTALLQQYHAAGFGGVEICPIYGALGYEARYVPYLSPQWILMLAHTTTEARRLGMGVDMTTGTGWPFGGPGVGAEDASSRLVLKRYEVAGGSAFSEPLPRGRLQYLLAVSDRGERVDLTGRAHDGRLDWTAPAGNWRLYVVAQSGPAQRVKRAAPGGEGNVVDPYSTAALDHYLAGFDRALAGFAGPMPRAQFHDSFEYAGASWTPELFDTFRRLRGYDLRDQLPALFGDGPDETVARVKCDYRETISDLHLAWVRRWTEWAHAHGELSRDQAHGAPGNLLDIYAAADIPETETFRDVDGRLVPMLKLASSAAHAAERPLASAESFTWLGEHFQTTLGDLKPAADLLFLSGINHLVYHGIAYSPKDAGWPGWLFYASVHFGPNGGLWRDLPAFNAYVTRCQSVLQQGRPDNDVLLYFPVYDLWQKPDGMLMQLTTPGKWMWDTPFHTSAMDLWKRGYGFDQVSDALLAHARYADGRVRLGSGAYHAIVVPDARLMPVETLRRLLDLARAGATVLFAGAPPSDVPGFGRLDERRAELRRLLESVPKADPDHGVREAAVGRGRVLVGGTAEALLEAAGVGREPMADAGLQCVRRITAEGWDYFVVNRGDKTVDGWVPLGRPARAAALLDPCAPDRAGFAALRRRGGATEVYLQLAPGESCVLRALRDRVEGRPWVYERPSGEARTLEGTWSVRFIEGGPALPAAFETRGLVSWTTRDDPEARRFAGTARYTLAFDWPGAAEQKADDWLLDLGRVCDSARVILNGHAVGTLWHAPFVARVGPWLKPGRNVLDVEVTNLPANRIADLDRRGVAWKQFYEINFVNRDYQPFDASGWPPRDSGLLGPVRLVPMRRAAPTEGKP